MYIDYHPRIFCKMFATISPGGGLSWSVSGNIRLKDCLSIIVTSHRMGAPHIRVLFLFVSRGWAKTKDKRRANIYLRSVRYIVLSYTDINISPSITSLDR